MRMMPVAQIIISAIIICIFYFSASAYIQSIMSRRPPPPEFSIVMPNGKFENTEFRNGDGTYVTLDLKRNTIFHFVGRSSTNIVNLDGPKHAYTSNRLPSDAEPVYRRFPVEPNSLYHIEDDKITRNQISPGVALSVWTDVFVDNRIVYPKDRDVFQMVTCSQSEEVSEELLGPGWSH